ncbi:jg15167 [Pararge aegeria aegeria]|uniref:Jg15167 protein n=2 Tax=Pararge aegeria aegeria TaxID=348720 RepID=A0A8S4SPG8_9NEOP|nr:jg15167 [Pararge aegeria aegeria]
MSHVLKLFLKVIHSRIYSKCESQLSYTQFGFRNGLGTRDALFGYQVLVQRFWDMNRNLFVCFIDYEKAFDRVRHVKLMQVLQKIGLDFKDCRFIKNLYWNQSANIRVNRNLSSYIDIERGVRQGCILSPLLFNLYAEAIFSEALDNISDGISINGKTLNNIRYADDTILIADSLEGLQNIVNSVASVSAEYGININTKKTKFMEISRTPELINSLYLNGQVLERVSKFRYLGTMVDDKGDHSLEVRCRIEQARNTFSRLKRVLCDRNLSIALRTRIARCYVFSVLLYGVEAWTLTETMSRKLEAFEMWVYRRMLKISWTDRVRNSTVLQRMGKVPEVLLTIKKRKLEYFGHVMRNTKKYELLQLIVQGKVAGRRRPGRRRISWLKNLRQWFGKSTKSLFRAAVSKVEIALMIANLRKETAP